MKMNLSKLRLLLYVVLATFPTIKMAKQIGPSPVVTRLIKSRLLHKQRCWRGATSSHSAFIGSKHTTLCLLNSHRGLQPAKVISSRCGFLHTYLHPQYYSNAHTRHSPFNRLSTQIFTSMDDNSSSKHQLNLTQTIDTVILKKEIARLILRTHKKIGKVSARIQGAKDRMLPYHAAKNEYILNNVDDGIAPSHSTSETDGDRFELVELQIFLQKLNWLEQQLNSSILKKKSKVTLDEIMKLLPENNVGLQIIEYIQELDINKTLEEKNRRIDEDAQNKRSKKERAHKEVNQCLQNQQVSVRLPYRRYFTENKIEIRVGKQATDNDVLSLSPEHRSPSHWWYHASGCPGSHVILCTDASSPSDDDVLDAASLAALKSKCIGQSVIKVSMTRARNVSKPPGSKPGLVQLNGDVKTIVLKKDAIERRCERLEKTVVVN